MSSIRTILFDLDGTLIDTNELIIASFVHTFEKYNLQFSREEVIEFNGPTLKETFTRIAPDKVDEMIDTYRLHNHSVHDDYVTAFPKTLETIKYLKEGGIQLGIVTTKMSPTVKMGLALTKLDTYFDTVVTLDDVSHPKPHPEPVLKAMANLDAKASSTLMVGDNSHDIEAGRAAGVRTAGVAWAHKGRERLLAYNPTYMLEEMTDLIDIIGV